MLSETEYAQYTASREHSKAHPLCQMIRSLRRAAGISLGTFETRTGIPGVVVGAYERGDRVPPLSKLDTIFRHFGYQITAIPVGAASVRMSGDMIADLRAIANQLESMNVVSELPDDEPLDD